MKCNICFLFIFLVFILPLPLLAQTTPEYLVGIGVDPNANFNDYINSLYVLSIALAALLAVIKIIVAGLKWMLTDLVTSKEDAKKDIQGAVLGLIIIVAAVIILETINPRLTKTTLFFSPADAPDFSDISIEEKRGACLSEFNNTSWNESSGVCDPIKDDFEGKYSILQGEKGCTAPGDCAAQIAECEAGGGTAHEAMSLSIPSVPLNFKITCSAASSISNCEANGGTWDYARLECK